MEELLAAAAKAITAFNDNCVWFTWEDAGYETEETHHDVKGSNVCVQYSASRKRWGARFSMKERGVKEALLKAFGPPQSTDVDGTMRWTIGDLRVVADECNLRIVQVDKRESTVKP